MKPLRLAIDLDNTIHDTKNVLPGYKMGQPIEGAVGALQKLKNEGAIIVIHTVWANSQQRVEAISKWCRFFSIPYDFITNEKPEADLYLGDKYHEFTTWEEALESISKLSLES